MPLKLFIHMWPPVLTATLKIYQLSFPPFHLQFSVSTLFYNALRMSSQFVGQPDSSDEEDNNVPLVVLDADLSAPIDDYDGVPRTQYVCHRLTTSYNRPDNVAIYLPGTLLWLTLQWISTLSKTSWLLMTASTNA